MFRSVKLRADARLNKAPRMQTPAALSLPHATRHTPQFGCDNDLRCRGGLLVRAVPRLRGAVGAGGAPSDLARVAVDAAVECPWLPDDQLPAAGVRHRLGHPVLVPLRGHAGAATDLARRARPLGKKRRARRTSAGARVAPPQKVPPLYVERARPARR